MSQLVLLVDADEDTRVILRAYLEHAGLRVLDTGDGEAGLELARAHRPDLVIGDFPLDVRGHSPFTGALRELAGADVPVLTVTARATAEELVEARAVSRLVLTKPVSPRRVLKEIRRLLSQS